MLNMNTLPLVDPAARQLAQAFAAFDPSRQPLAEYRASLANALAASTPAAKVSFADRIIPRAHWKVLAASDFLTVEVWTGRGLVTHYLLFVISLTDRVVKIAGITTRPDESWMLQIARNVTDSQAGALHSKRYLIIDRDTKYSEQFRRLIRDAGTNVIRLPPRSPNLNAYAGAVRTLDQRRMPESNDLHRAGILTPRRGRIHGSLSQRTQPSGS
jgi:transposase InsO family protein